MSSLLDELFNREEDTVFELKESVPRDMIKHLIALSNHKGGRIIIGVSDDRKIYGIEDANSIKAQLYSIANSCFPAITIEIKTEMIDNKEIMIVHLLKGKYGPYSHEGRYYIRRNSNSVPITSKEEVLSLMIEFGQTSYGASPIVFNKYLTPTPEISIEKVKGFIKNSKQRRNFSDKEELDIKNILKNLKCLTIENGEEVLTVAGLLFFTKNPQEILPHTMVKIVRFKGKETSIPIDRENLKGTLPELIEASISFIKRNTSKKIIIRGLKRLEKTEYPIIALREAITNAVAHRNYAIKQQNVRIFIFDDRIEIKTPGGLPPPVNLNNITSAQYSREPLICNLLFHCGYMDEWGTGINRIMRIMNEWGLKKPDFLNDESDFTIVLYNEQIKEDTSTSLNGSLIKETDLSKLSPQQLEAIEYVSKNKMINREQYVQLTGVSPPTATRHLSELENMKVFKARGSGKSIFYILNEE